MADPMASEPLLVRPQDSSEQSSLSQQWDAAMQFASSVKNFRARGRHILSSPAKHYIVMGLVILDVAALLLNVFIQLIACEMHQRDELWVKGISQGLEIAGLVFSCLFMVELLACLFAFGLGFFSEWFHVFDSTIIVLSFIIDVATPSLAENIGSLIIALRLWRLAKLSEEIVAGASERIDDLEQRNQELSDQIKNLRSQQESAHNYV